MDQPAEVSRVSSLRSPSTLLMPSVRASTAYISTGIWSEFNQRPERRAPGSSLSAIYERSRVLLIRPLERLGQPRRGFVQLLGQRSGYSAEAGRVSCCCCGSTGCASMVSMVLTASRSSWAPLVKTRAVS